MSSLRRITASRANGALARGRKTPAGIVRSSQNAIRHGLLAKTVVLDNESADGFKDVLAEYETRMQPADNVELGMVEEMVASWWRLRRLWAIETSTLDTGIHAQPPGDELARITAAFSDPANAPQLNLLHRYETRIHRMYQRALYNLALLRETMPNDPSPISEHLPDIPEAA